jgi:hypothetical protein
VRLLFKAPREEWIPGSARLDRAIFWTIYAQEKPNKGERDAGLQFMQFNNPIQNNK